MITHKLNDFTIGFIDVPSMAFGFDIQNYTTEVEFIYMLNLEEISPELCNDETLVTIKLSSTGNWQIFSTDSREVTEEQASEVMPKIDDSGLTKYFDYVKGYHRHSLFTALESYNSMKVMLGVIDVNPYQRVPDFAFEEAEDINQIQGLNILRHQYNQAQSQVKRYVVVIKKD